MVCVPLFLQASIISPTHIPQQYVSQLATVREDALKEASTQLALVGCGDWKLIENYKSASTLPNTLLPVTHYPLHSATQETLNSKEKSMPIQTGSSTMLLA
jgi:hypothetical protein